MVRRLAKNSGNKVEFNVSFYAKSAIINKNEANSNRLEPFGICQMSILPYLLEVHEYFKKRIEICLCLC